MQASTTRAQANTSIRASFNPNQAFNQDYAPDELIIQYHHNENLISKIIGSTAQEEQSFFAKLNIQYQIWDEADTDEQLDILKAKIRKLRKNGKLKKLKKAKKLRKAIAGNYAILKLDHHLEKEEIEALISRMNSEHYLSDNFEIDAVYPNYVYEISQTSDPLNDQQQDHDMVKPEKLWKYSKGEGVVVAVIDTGIDMDHEDLVNNIWTNNDEIPNNGKDDDKNGFIDDVHGWDFINKANSNCSFNEDCSKEDNDPNDVNGHGTHVAGIIAAQGNNNIGISGIAPEATIMPLKAGYSTGSSAFLLTSDIIQALNYAVDNDADIINMSFAGYGLNVLESLINSINRQGVLCVAAAGNNSSDAPIYPAAIDSVLAVGATADGYAKSFFSNFGTWVDITAPGSWILSTVPNNRYDHKSGTSMAAPIVAGVAALLKGKNPNSSVAAIKNLILNNATETSFVKFQGAQEYLGGVSADISFPFELIYANFPTKAQPGEEVFFQAEASEGVVEYSWSSTLDGNLSNEASFTTDSLSLGTHSISVRARNAEGQWSNAIIKTINISEEIVIDPNQNNGNNNDDDREVSILSNRIRIIRRDRRFFAAMTRATRKQIQAFRWTSNRDGVVSFRRGFRKRRLSPGSHLLTLEVQDKFGNWTTPLERYTFRYANNY